VVVPTATAKPTVKPKARVDRVQRKKAVKLTGAKARRVASRAVAVPAATSNLDVGDTTTSNRWLLLVLFVAALAISAFAATPATVMPRPLAARRLEIATIGLALVVGAGFSLLMAGLL
jgi:hypothetical protein